MRFFTAAHLPARIHLMDGVQQWIGLVLGPSIIKIAHGECILIREFLIDTDSEIILVRDGRQRYVKGLGNSVGVYWCPSGGFRPEFQVRSNCGDRKRPLR